MAKIHYLVGSGPFSGMNLRFYFLELIEGFRNIYQAYTTVSTYEKLIDLGDIT